MAAPARAEASPLSPSVAVNAGVVAAVAPGRASPSMELSAALRFADSRWSLAALFDGWTLGPSGTYPASSEITGALGPAIRGALTQDLFWTVAAGPAFSYSSTAVGESVWRPGVVVAPGIELATRRLDLALDLGGRAMLFTNGPRFALVAGARYAF